MKSIKLAMILSLLIVTTHHILGLNLDQQSTEYTPFQDQHALLPPSLRAIEDGDETEGFPEPGGGTDGSQGTSNDSIVPNKDGYITMGLFIIGYAYYIHTKKRIDKKQ